MKGACIIVKNDTFFSKVSSFLNESELNFKSSDECLQISYSNGKKFTLFCYSGEIEELSGDSKKLYEDGYIIEHIVDCRWEDLFCLLIKKISHIEDFIVIDNSGKLYHPNEITENSIVL